MTCIAVSDTMWLRRVNGPSKCEKYLIKKKI
uniref:Uncharacterized protein n=1 Tax=Anguilla anguilla TaxID=7936 RepID=A0A0E9SBP8_ANGAN